LRHTPSLTRPSARGTLATSPRSTRCRGGSFGCESVAPGYDPTNPWSCENADGTDGALPLTVDSFFGFEDSSDYGLNYPVFFKDVCPETCGVPCAHAPTEDADDVFMRYLLLLSDYELSCADLAAHGYCDWTAAGAVAAPIINWLCGASCGGYAECSLGYDEASELGPAARGSTEIYNCPA